MGLIMGAGVVFGLLSGWVLCVEFATACEVGATVLLQTNSSRNVSIAAIKGHRVPVTGIGKLGSVDQNRLSGKPVS